MILTVDSKKSVVAFREDLPRAAADRKFGVLGVLDLAAKMREKGVDYNGEVLIFELCNPHKAKAVLESSPELSSFLPCRVSVYRAADGSTKLTTIRPTALIQSVGATDLMAIAGEVEADLTAIMNDAR